MFEIHVFFPLKSCFPCFKMINKCQCFFFLQTSISHQNWHSSLRWVRGKQILLSNLNSLFPNSSSTDCCNHHLSIHFNQVDTQEVLPVFHYISVIFEDPHKIKDSISWKFYKLLMLTEVPNFTTGQNNQLQKKLSYSSFNCPNWSFAIWLLHS